MCVSKCACICERNREQTQSHNDVSLQRICYAKEEGKTRKHLLHVRDFSKILEVLCCQNVGEISLITNS